MQHASEVDAIPGAPSFTTSTLILDIRIQIDQYILCGSELVLSLPAFGFHACVRHYFPYVATPVVLY